MKTPLEKKLYEAISEKIENSGTKKAVAKEATHSTIDQEAALISLRKKWKVEDIARFYKDRKNIEDSTPDEIAEDIIFLVSLLKKYMPKDLKPLDS